LDRVGPAQADRCRDFFRRAVDLELSFFEAAYADGTWYRPRFPRELAARAELHRNCAPYWRTTAWPVLVGPTPPCSST